MERVVKSITAENSGTDGLEPIEAFAKLAIRSIDINRVEQFEAKGTTPEIKKSFWIYFSPSQSSHGPRVKFYGGTKETRPTEKGISFAFGSDGATDVELENWQNDKKIAPLAFNDDVLLYVERFINTFLAGLNLVWYGRLEQHFLLNFMSGIETWEDMLQEIEIADNLYDELMQCKDFSALHLFCKKHNLYNF